MSNFWDTRYKKREYVYGKHPNSFLKQQLSLLEPGYMLLPAEGEGRNAVYAASLGWHVDAFDFSTEARKKASKLADENKVEINYFNSKLEAIELNGKQYDCIGLVYVHMPSSIRSQVHKRLVNHLRPGGRVILEAFAEEQIKRNSGGPKNTDMLFSKEKLEEDFSAINISILEQKVKTLDEGKHHQGKADVLQMLAFKR